MTSAKRTQLNLVEAKLFASIELSVIEAIDASDDATEAVVRLRDLGMSSTEAAVVLEMPLRIRTQHERRRLFDEAALLRDQLTD